MANARELERAGACVVVPDAELPARFETELLTLLNDASRRARMGQAALLRARPHAADEIWTQCRKLLGLPANGAGR